MSSKQTKDAVQNYEYALDIPTVLAKARPTEFRWKLKDYVDSNWAWNRSPTTLLISDPPIAKVMFQSGAYCPKTGTYIGLRVLIGTPELGNKILQ